MSAEAFERLHLWKDSGAVLKLAVLEKGNATEEFTVQISSIDEESHIVSFAESKTGSIVPAISFVDAVYVIGKTTLEAVRPTGDVLMSEEYTTARSDETREPSQNHFDIRFTKCSHKVTFPLKHSTGHIYCYVCQPHLQKLAVPGNCPDCERQTSAKG